MLFILIIAFTILVNALFLWKVFGKNYRNFLIEHLKELAQKLNYEIIDDQDSNKSSFNSGKLIIGNDLYSRHDISKMTTLYFAILSYHTNKKIPNKGVYFIYQLSNIFSIVFSMWIFTTMMDWDLGILGFSFLAIFAGCGIVLIACCIFYLSYKKIIHNFINKDIEIRKIYLSLYWYLPIIMLNISIGIIYQIKWLFSSNER